MKRTCNTCKKQKDISEYSYLKNDKKQKKCKLCQSIYYKKWYRKNGRIRADNYMDVIYEWRANNPEKHSAHMKIYHAIKSGKIVKPKQCSMCGYDTDRLSAHHTDYDKIYQVQWLCSSCHKKVHIPIDNIQATS